MTSLVPYPVLAAGLAVMWLLLSGISAGQLVLAAAVSIGATHTLRALGEARPKIGRWLAIPELFGIVLYDIVRSNIAVTRIILAGSRKSRTSGFIVVPTRLRHPGALAILCIILTATPGTAWVDYSSTRNELLIHILDLVEEDDWAELIGNRYERLLLEIFE